MSLFDDMVKAAKKMNPDFDEHKTEHLDALTRAFVLSNYDKKDLREAYLRDVIENAYREKLKNMLKESKFPRVEEIEAETKILELEREIVERKTKVLKEFMD